MGRSVDLDDLIDVGEVAALLGLAHKNSVTTYLRRYADFPAPALEFAEGKCRAWVREDVERWHERREEPLTWQPDGPRESGNAGADCFCRFWTLRAPSSLRPSI